MSLHAVVLNHSLDAFKLILMMRLKGAVTFLLFLTLFVWPVFEIFNKEVLILDMPLPVIYIFTIWVLSVIVAYKGGK